MLCLVHLDQGLHYCRHIFGLHYCRHIFNSYNTFTMSLISFTYNSPSLTLFALTHHFDI